MENKMGACIIGLISRGRGLQNKYQIKYFLLNMRIHPMYHPSIHHYKISKPVIFHFLRASRNPILMPKIEYSGDLVEGMKGKANNARAKGLDEI